MKATSNGLEITRTRNIFDAYYARCNMLRDGLPPATPLIKFARTFPPLL